MRNEISLEKMNRQTLFLMQALKGSVSPNFRMVMLEYDEGMWRLIYILEHDSSYDREEIGEIKYDFLAFQETSIYCETIIEIDDGELPWPRESLTKRIVYRRREN